MKKEEIQYKVNKDTRRVLSLLSSICMERGVEFDVSSYQGYLCDMLMMMYYPTPIIKILGSALRKVKKFQPKHGTIDYWLPMLMNMQKGASLKHAIRPDRQVPDWEENPITQIPLDRYEYVTSKYLLMDYGYDEMIMLHRIINTIDDKIIRESCHIGRTNDVYDIRYINAVITKEMAKIELKKNKMREMDAYITQTSNKLNMEIHQHSVLDMAQVEYAWESACENQKIEDKFNELISRGDI